MSDAEWREQLKEGDQVYVYGGFRFGCLSTVTAATPKTVTVMGKRFPRTTGCNGTGDKRRHLREPTLCDIDGKRRTDAIAALRSFTSSFGDRRIESVPTSRIEQAVALLTSEGET
jgi:hypothetical protein